MNEKKLQQVLPSLVKQAEKYEEERTFFWPNQSRFWLDSVSKQIDLSQRTSNQILVVGGVLYSCYLAAKGYSTVVVEKNPIAAISQLYACWLIDRGASLKDVGKAFLLHLIGKRKRAHQREKIDIPKEEYLAALNQFKKFLLTRDDRVSVKIFDKILGITRGPKDKRQFSLIKKGVGLIGFSGVKFKLPKKIIIADICYYSPEKLGKFNLIITTNVIDFFSVPEEFFFAIFPLLKRNGFLEITVYNKEARKKLQELFWKFQRKTICRKSTIIKKTYF